MKSNCYKKFRQPIFRRASKNGFLKRYKFLHQNDFNFFHHIYESTAIMKYYYKYFFLTRKYKQYFCPEIFVSLETSILLFPHGLLESFLEQRELGEQVGDRVPECIGRSVIGRRLKRRNIKTSNQIKNDVFISNFNE